MNSESSCTHQIWAINSARPSLLILACLIANLIALVVMIAVNAMVANQPDNDYGSGFGWAIMAPTPAAGLLWTLIDIFLVGWWILHPVYYLVEAIILGLLYVILGGFSIGAYSWDDDGSWVPGMFFIFNFVLYTVIAVISSMVIHKAKPRPQHKDIGSRA